MALEPETSPDAFAMAVTCSSEQLMKSMILSLCANLNAACSPVADVFASASAKSRSTRMIGELSISSAKYFIPPEDESCNSPLRMQAVCEKPSNAAFHSSLVRAASVAGPLILTRL